MAELIRLGSHYWTPDFTRAQANSLLADYIDDLTDCTVTQLEVACREWRRNAENTRFPRSAELVRAVFGSKPIPCRLPTWKGVPTLEGPRATKSVGQILREHGFTDAAKKWGN